MKKMNLNLFRSFFRSLGVTISLFCASPVYAQTITIGTWDSSRSLLDFSTYVGHDEARALLDSTFAGQVQYQPLQTITGDALCDVDVVFMDAYRGQPTASEIAALSDYVQNGGTVLAHVGDLAGCPANASVDAFLLPFGLSQDQAHCGQSVPHCYPPYAVTYTADPIIDGPHGTVSLFENCAETPRIAGTAGAGGITLAQDSWGDSLVLLPRGAHGSGQALFYMNAHWWIDVDQGFGGKLSGANDNDTLLLNLVSSAMLQPRSCAPDLESDQVYGCASIYNTPPSLELCELYPGYSAFDDTATIDNNIVEFPGAWSVTPISADFQSDSLDIEIVGNNFHFGNLGFVFSDLDCSGQCTIADVVLDSISGSPSEPNINLKSLDYSENSIFIVLEGSVVQTTATVSFNISTVSLPSLAGPMTEIISVDSSGAHANGDSIYPSISGDGRFVAFSSSATNLVAADNNGKSDIFVHDRETGVTERVSIDSMGAEGDSSSYEPSISADGRYVAFFSSATNLVTEDSNEVDDVFVYDRDSGITERVSVDNAGIQGDDHSRYPSISTDGRFVAFHSLASNLVTDDNNEALDVFVYDRDAGTTEMVSLDSSGQQALGISHFPSISASGRYVAFESYASNLVAGDTNNRRDIFVHDRDTGGTQRVSVSSTGAQANHNTFLPSISGNGRYVAFYSPASNLVLNDTNSENDIFVHDRELGRTERISVNSDGVEGDSDSYFPSMNGNGGYLTFISAASNLVADDNNSSYDVFLHNRNTGETQRASVNSIGSEGNDNSGRPSNTNDGSISADGRHVVFWSQADNLVTGDHNNKDDIFVRSFGLGPDDDQDKDGVIDKDDNCPTIPNPDQTDTNNDGYGDACVPPDVDIPDSADIGAGTVIGTGTTINAGVSVGENSTIGDDVIINKNSSIGDNAVIGDGSEIAKDVTAGDELTLGENVVINKDVIIGDNVTIGDNSVIGRGTVIGSDAQIGIIGGGIGVEVGKTVTIGSGEVIADGSVIPANSTVP